MNRVRNAIAVVAAGLLLTILVGCGEKDEPETTGPVVTAETSVGSTTTTTSFDETGTPAEAAATVVDDFLRSSDPAQVCDEELTDAFLKRSYGDRQGCLAARKTETLATAAKVEKPAIKGSSATTTARATGGLYDKQALDFTLVLEGGQWKIDKLDSNVPVGP